jgi:hypothetical protein
MNIPKFKGEKGGDKSAQETDHHSLRGDALVFSIVPYVPD